MAVTVKQLMEKLLTLPQHAEVEVLKEVSCMGGWETTTEFHPIDLDVTVFDFRDEVKWPKQAGRIIVALTAE